MYDKILVPLDTSRRAERVLAHVEQLAQSFHAEVVLLHVFEHMATVRGPYSPVLDTETEHKLDNEVSNYLQSWKGELREKGLKVRTRTEHGPVVRAIIDVASDEDADLIAMTSHGRTGLGQVFYGSVAAGVLQRVDRPLLLVRAE